MPGPWLKFYPADWQSDPLLGTCSLAARGLWIEMLCVMHSADPPGSLVRRGAALTLAQIAILARCQPRDATKLLAELGEAGVYSRDEDGVIFSRRIRRDVAKAERDRQNGKGGGNPALKPDGRRKPDEGVNPQDNPSLNGGDKAQIPEARYQKEEPSREQPGLTGEARPSPRRREASPPPDPTAWDNDAPFGRDAAAGGAR